MQLMENPAERRFGKVNQPALSAKSAIRDNLRFVQTFVQFFGQQNMRNVTIF